MPNSTPYAGAIRPAQPGDLDLLVAIDDDSCALYAAAGIDLSFGAESPIVRDERAAWAAAIAQGGVRLAAGSDPQDADGFIAMGRKDGIAYLEQLSVRCGAMRRGIGGRLMAWGEDWTRSQGQHRLRLTTYAHVPWNRPFYERHGWLLLPEAQWGPDLRATLALQRAHLPDPDQRVAMEKTL